MSSLSCRLVSAPESTAAAKEVRERTMRRVDDVPHTQHLRSPDRFCHWREPVFHPRLYQIRTQGSCKPKWGDIWCMRICTRILAENWRLLSKDVHFSLDLSLSVSYPGDLDLHCNYSCTLHDLMSAEFLLQASLPKKQEYTWVNMTKTLLFSAYCVAMCPPGVYIFILL